MKHLLALVLFVFVLTGCGRETESTVEIEAPLEQEIQWLNVDGSEANATAVFLSPGNPDHQIILETFTYPEGGIGLEYLVQTTSQTRGKVSGQHVAKEFNRVFDLTSVDTPSTGTISLGGRDHKVQVYLAQTNDGRTLRFEVADAIPCGGLIRIMEKGADDIWTTNFEIIGHTPVPELSAVTGPSLSETGDSPWMIEARPEWIEYTADYFSLQAGEAVSDFLDAWNAAGQPPITPAFCKDNSPMLNVIGKRYIDHMTAEKPLGTTVDFNLLTGLPNAEALSDFSIARVSRTQNLHKILVDVVGSNGTTHRITYEVNRQEYKGEQLFSLQNVYYTDGGQLRQVVGKN